MYTLSMNFLSLLPWYFFIMNLFAAGITIADKRRAVRHKYRVPERVLLLISLLGGSIAMYATMRIIRHKTQHPKFMVGIPLILVVQLFLLLFLLFARPIT